RDDQVHLAVLDERLAVRGDGLDPLDVPRLDAERAGEDLPDLDVEADGLAVGAGLAEQGLVELGADRDLPGLGEGGHGRAPGEGGGVDLGGFGLAPSGAAAGGEAEGRGGPDGSGEEEATVQGAGHDVLLASGAAGSGADGGGAVHFGAVGRSGGADLGSDGGTALSGGGSCRGSPSRGRSRGRRRTPRARAPRRSARSP